MRHLKLLTVLFVLFVIAACNSQARRIDSEKLGTTVQPLLAQGSPCLQNSHCETGFCVDAVCCENACGGGERDNFSCSNIYGTVAGLVDGKCTQLKPGDACGKLETFDPCTWRGTVLNGGNNCPNPPFGSSAFACYDCGGGQTCPDGVPVCVGGQCLGCNGNFNSGATRACPTAVMPACVSGACLECSQSDTTACTVASGKPICDFANNVCIPGCLTNNDCTTPTSPICDLVSHQCVACNGDFGTLATHACFDPANPACLPNGDCVPCDADTGCTAGQVCNVTNNTCVECNTTADCTGVEVCNPTTGTCEPPCDENSDCGGNTPICLTPPGVCVECTPTNTTNCPTNEPKCDPTNNTCVGCNTNADCPGDKPICDPATKTCTATCTASSQCPGDTPICNPATKVCVECTSNADCPANEPICNPTTGQCGTTCTESVQCPGDKPICNPTTKTCVECISNANCVAPEVCDTTTGNCGPCTTSAQCPGDTPICDPATKKCVECTSNANCTPPEVCDTTTGNCTTECTTSAQCPGDTPVCDPATKKCVDCVSNSDCPSGQICNQSTKTCETPPPGTQPTQPTQPTQNNADAFDIQGAGCNCSTTGDNGQSGAPGALLGVGLALTMFLRRRKEQHPQA